MSIDYEDTVAIFWDYENCELPGAADAFAMTGGIRRIAHEYGAVTVFRAYFEMTDLVSPRSVAIRSDLQACGVSLIDCPHNGRKDVADKMMLVDMLVHALGSSLSTTIVLISGDRDFLYAVSVLRLRKFRIILMSPTSVHPSLKAQATAVYEWPRHILQADQMSVLGEPAGALRERSGSSARTGLPTPPAPKSILPPATTTTTTTIPTTTTANQPVVPPPPPSPMSPTYSRSGLPSSVLAGTRARTASAQHTRSVSLTGVDAASSTLAPVPVTPRKTWADIVLRGPGSDSNTGGAQVSRTTDNNIAAPIAWRSRRVQAAAGLERVGIFAPPAITDGTETKPEEVTGLMDQDAENTSEDAETMTPEVPAEAQQEQDTESRELYEAFSPPPGLPQLLLSNAPFPSDANLLLGTDTSSNASDIGEYSNTMNVHPDIVIPTVVMIRLRKPPQKYKLLVRVLERERVQGNTRVVFSQLGSMLRQEHPSIYQRAGVTQLKEYIAMAEQDAVVVVGSNWENGNRWVALHPTYHGKPPEAINRPVEEPAGGNV